MKTGKRFGPEILERSVQSVFGEDTLHSQQRTKDNQAQFAEGERFQLNHLYCVHCFAPYTCDCVNSFSPRSQLFEIQLFLINLFRQVPHSRALRFV